MKSAVFDRFYNSTNGLPRIVGHRGLRPVGETSTNAAENTLAAFAIALEQGADGFETDVRLSRDGVPVLAHDGDLRRVTGGDDGRATASLSAAELGRVPLARGGTIPTLDEALEWTAANRTVMNLEMKRDVPNRVALVRAVATSLGRSNAEVVVSSFDPFLLALLAPLRPNVPRALLLHAGQGPRAATLAIRLPHTFVQALHVEAQMITLDLARAANRLGQALGSWTVNDPSEARRLAKLGVRALITDTPGVIRAALSD